METLLNMAIEAALEAGKIIMEVYATPFDVYVKSDDSPVTQADLRASNLIKEMLKASDLPFVSEEDLPDDRSRFSKYWLVDPLDGTQEFVNRNGEFTVNISLIEDARPVLGVIYAPVSDTLWYAINEKSVKKLARLQGVEISEIAGNKTFKSLDFWIRRLLDCEAWQNSYKPEPTRPFTVLVSRSHRTQEVDDYIDRFLCPQHSNLLIDSYGSSLKFARLAENSADVYVCYSKTKEWDTAAADAILSAAGGKVLRISDGLPLAYSKEDYPNPPFVAYAPVETLHATSLQSGINPNQNVKFAFI